ncbi:hypothetical protein PHAVU_008G026000 [Phaseolus vulgaris]|uniref:F-box domain-containing protein n=1 Tax=Phaseolus vulgaris TaxID=3885 RepID=V7B1E0_PHAVU|nr:hypothetical protein PHAVU_008G026000g [Phaseolus vulgaris]ESW11390.1 hypothetical protein PHAVU_008G026000g [Phaseolus vulgaris]
MENHTLPLELAREILLRLPVRSVLRCKCVCKSWHSLISTPQFGISHYDLAASPSHRVLIKSKDFLVQSIDIDARLFKQSSAVHFLCLPPPPPRPSDDFHYKYELLGSCRGLVFLCYQGDLILWNPSMGVHKRFPNFECDLTDTILYAFGYDTSTANYCLVLVGLEESENIESQSYERKAEILIFSFKTALYVPSKSISFPYKCMGENFSAGALFSGAIHWLVLTEDENVPVIIAFDMIQKSLLDIPLFDHFTMGKYEVHSFGVMGECLSVCCKVQGCGSAEIWMMKEYNVQSSWTKCVVIPINDFLNDHFWPVCITKDGQIFGSNIGGRLEKRNHKGELLEFLKYGGGGELYYLNLRSALYRESLLFPSSEDDQQ